MLFFKSTITDAIKTLRNNGYSLKKKSGKYIISGGPIMKMTISKSELIKKANVLNRGF